MDPISITLLLVSTGLSIFGGVKQNQAVKAQGQKAAKDQAAANLVAAYEGEADTIAKRTAIEIETARLRATAYTREKQYQQLKLAGLSLLCIVGIGLVIKNLKSE